jgi:hypothetical protein
MNPGVGGRLGALAPVALILGIVGSACADAVPEGASPSPSQPPALGQAAPEFSLTTADRSEVRLQDLVAQGPVLFYFSMGPG